MTDGVLRPHAVLAHSVSPGGCTCFPTVYGQIKTANKSRMQHRTADKLVYCHETLHLQNKLQDANWEPDVVQHETDGESASDASDEEKDLADELSAPETLLMLMQ